MYLRRGFVTKREFIYYKLTTSEETKMKSITDEAKTYEIVSLEAEMMEKLIDFDTEIHTCSRREYLKAVLQPDRVTTIVALEQDTITGYGCVEKMNESYCIAPVYAKQRAVANALFSNLILSVPNNEDVYFIVHENNELMKELAMTYNATVKYTMPSMIKGVDTSVNFKDVYCIFDSDFGLV